MAEARQDVRINYDIEGLSDLKKAVNLTDDLAESTEELGEEQEQTKKKTDKANQSIGQSTKLFGSFTSQLKSSLNQINIAGKGLGDLGSNLVNVTTQTGKTSKAFRVLKFALASTGIGAIVVALGSLAVFLTKTQRGSEKLSQALAGLGAVTDVLIDRISLLGESFFAIFSGDLAKGGDLIKAAITGITDEIVSEATAAVELEERLQAVEKQEVSLIVAREKARAAVKALNKDAEDTSKSLEERQKAAQEAIRIENELQKERIAIQQERVNITRAQQALGENLLEDDRELAEAEAELFRIRQESDELLTTLQNKNNILIAQIQKQATETRDLTAAIEDRFNTEIQLAEQKEQLDTELEERTLERQQVFSEKEIAEKERAAGIERTIDTRTQQEKVRAAATGFSAIAGLIQQGLGDSKEAAIFGATISTAEAAIAAYKAVAGIPVVGPTLAPIAAAAATAFGLQSINQIRNTQIGGSSSSSNASGGFNQANAPRQTRGTFREGGRVGGDLHEAGGTIIEAERDEFVMSRTATNKYGFRLLEEINKGMIDPKSLSGASGVQVIDTRPIADQLKRMPVNVTKIDKDGFTQHQIRENRIITEKNLRYSGV